MSQVLSWLWKIILISPEIEYWKYHKVMLLTVCKAEGGRNIKVRATRRYNAIAFSCDLHWCRFAIGNV